MNKSKNTTRIYIYPITARFEQKYDNPYINDMIASLGDDFVCVNKDHPSKIGVLNLCSYFFKTNVFHLNWIEDLPDKKGGYIQTLFFLTFLFFAKISQKKIIWTAHNKISHHKTHSTLKNFLIKLLVRQSNYIITHSQEGVRFVNSLNGNPKTDTVLYIPHPIQPNLLESTNSIKYDLIIWGNIRPYKGIDRFLDYLKTQGLLEKYNMLIVGKVSDPDYERELKNYQSKNISILNQFIENEKLQELIKASSIILFTYQKEYVLSSGALTDSVAYGKNVIGPDIGAFRDLNKAGLIHTYKNFDDLIYLIDKLLDQNNQINSANLNQYFANNSWSNYGKKLHDLINRRAL